MCLLEQQTIILDIDMAHFAKLNSNNEVVEVIVVNNSDIQNLPFPESEPVGVAYLQSIFGENPAFTWKQTSYNNNFRKRYAIIGGSYDSAKDGFIPPAPDYPSWVFNEEKWIWESPVPYPNSDTGEIYYWDEENRLWVLVTDE